MINVYHFGLQTFQVIEPHLEEPYNSRASRLTWTKVTLTSTTKLESIPMESKWSEFVLRKIWSTRQLFLNNEALECLTDKTAWNWWSLWRVRTQNTCLEDSTALGSSNSLRLWLIWPTILGNSTCSAPSTTNPVQVKDGAECGALKAAVRWLLMVWFATGISMKRYVALKII